MITDRLDLPVIEDQNAFNARRWEEVCADPALASLEKRIETNRFGEIVMTPPPGFEHADHQSEIHYQLRTRLPEGKALTECPVSTADGVKAADAVWISMERLTRARKGSLLTLAPEICVEVLSPANIRAQIDEKRHLYFDAGADEVWICDLSGQLHFFRKEAPDQPVDDSTLCPNFPKAL